MASSPKTKLWFAVCKGGKTVYGATEDLWAQPRCQCSGKRRQQRHFCRGCCTSSVSVHTRLCACTGVHGCPPWCTRVGHGPCSRGTRLHTPQGSASPQYPCPAAPALWPPPGAEQRKVRVSGTPQCWGPPVTSPSLAQLPGPLVHLPLSLPHQLHIHTLRTILAPPLLLATQPTSYSQH